MSADSAPSKPSRLRRLLKWVVVVVLVGAAVVAFLPTLLSTSLARDAILTWLADNVDRKVEFATLDVSWAHGIRLEGLRVSDPANPGEPLLEAPLTEIDAPIFPKNAPGTPPRPRLAVQAVSSSPNVSSSLTPKSITLQAQVASGIGTAPAGTQEREPPRVLLREFGRDVPRRVRRPVVNDDQFHVAIALAQGRPNRVAEKSLGVIAWHDDRDERIPGRHRIGSHCPWRCHGSRRAEIQRPAAPTRSIEVMLLAGAKTRHG
jgi:hypothetical protein